MAANCMKPKQMNKNSMQNYSIKKDSEANNLTIYVIYDTML